MQMLRAALTIYWFVGSGAWCIRECFGRASPLPDQMVSCAPLGLMFLPFSFRPGRDSLWLWQNMILLTVVGLMIAMPSDLVSDVFDTAVVLSCRVVTAALWIAVAVAIGRARRSANNPRTEGGDRP
jgi:hypothetical protein